VVSPLETIRSLPREVAARYNGAAQQRACILLRLRTGPATRTEIERDCNAPSVTKRISELRAIGRREGWRIHSEQIDVTAPDGGVNVATVYSLNEGDAAQPDLFDPT
jgi:hypothetical protein